MAMAFVIALGVAGLTIGVAGAPPVHLTDGAYTAAQAERGRALYRTHCNYCHHEDLLGGEDLRVIPPALIGISFTERWVGKPLAEYVRVIAATMPWEGERLAAQEYADIVAYLLLEIGYPAGTSELPPDPAALAGVSISAP